MQGVRGAPPRTLKIWRDEHCTSLPLGEGIRYVVGRHDAADVVFEHTEVSRLHGVLCFDEGEWWFEDYGSAAGTSLRCADDERGLSSHIPERVVAGDVLCLGTERCRLELLAEELAEQDVDDETTVSDAALTLRRRIELAAMTRVPVFLLGCSGSGKSWAAQKIHKQSGAQGPFVSINCARLPSDPDALHSELLGHVRGAYSGADAPRVGRLLFADGGTLFLDEVECLSTLAQGFLLDVLENSGDLAPLGTKGPTLHAPIFRLVSASKRPLGEGALRADLSERLAEGHMWRLPTLAERRADIPGLVRSFAREQEKLLGTSIALSEGALRLACEAEWPGQIRQLRATILSLLQLELAERALRGGGSGAIVLREAALRAHLEERDEAWGLRVKRAPSPSPASRAAREEDPGAPQRGDSRRLSRELVLEALAKSDGNQSEAARRLGVARNTLARKMKQFDIAKRLG